MKSLNALLLGLLITISQVTFAAPNAGYYRVWQGFKLDTLSTAQFQNQLPDFMNATTSLYRDSLNQYLVALPPIHKPEFVPDEFALVALPDEETYRAIRATPEGKAYSEAHWQIFEKSKSKSLPLDTQIPNPLVAGRSYDLIGGSNDWGTGSTTFFLGLRKHGVSNEQFLKRLSEHVQLVAQSLQPLGLRGYIVIADDNYEAAYMNWVSTEAMNYAFTTPEGKAVASDAAAILDTLQWTPQVAFNGRSVAPDTFYKTK